MVKAIRPRSDLSEIGEESTEAQVVYSACLPECKFMFLQSAAPVSPEESA